MTVAKSRSSVWSREQDIAFENALATYPEDSAFRWEKIAADVPGKNLEEVINHYELLLDDVCRIESGCVPLPCYNSFSVRSSSHGGDERTGKKSGISGRLNGESNDGGKSTNLEQDRRKGIAWTEDEHRLFLLGLEKYGKGDWRSISRNFVLTRTPTQVASHAQKYFIRLNSMNKDRRRTSIHDITSVNNGDVSVPQGPITGQTIGAGAGGSSGKSNKQFAAAPIAPLGVGIYGMTTIGQRQLVLDEPINSITFALAVGIPVNLSLPTYMSYDVQPPILGAVVAGAPINMSPMTYMIQHTSAHSGIGDMSSCLEMEVYKQNIKAYAYSCWCNFFHLCLNNIF